MGQILRGSATTTETVRRAIQARQESVRAAAKHYGISLTAVQKWRSRPTSTDARMGPKEPHSTVLSLEHEAVFRPNGMPEVLFSRRYLGTSPVLRDEPKRADAPWIHGRGHDPRTDRLMSSTVTILGCGSVGAPVAVALAQAGVGRLILVDHDELGWANVGRHPLGAGSVRLNKAKAMAAKLRVDYPHGRFECESASTRDPAKTQLRLSSSCENQDQGGVTIGADRDPTLMKDFAYISM